MKQEHWLDFEGFDEKSDRYYFYRRAVLLYDFLKGLKKDASILDFGCGTGNFTKFIREKGYRNVVGTDISKILLESAKAKGNNVFLAKGEKIPVKSESFDAIILTDVIEHLPDLNKSFGELWRVLKKNGRVFITYPNPFWVPVLNLFGFVGIKCDSRDNMARIKKIRRFCRGRFKFRKFEGHMLFSKLPKGILGLLEKIEKRMPAGFMRAFGLMREIVLEKEA